ncbi:hypothetical protein Q6U64_004350 [Vibrio vulnificus]|nr:hypothetical protein [Vibrio vulnificus]
MKGLLIKFLLGLLAFSGLGILKHLGDVATVGKALKRTESITTDIKAFRHADELGLSRVGQDAEETQSITGREVYDAVTTTNDLNSAVQSPVVMGDNSDCGNGEEC